MFCPGIPKFLPKFFWVRFLLFLNFNKYLEILTVYIKEYISKYKIKCIKLYGDYKDITKLINKLERKVRKEVYIYTQPDIIPLCYFIE